MGSVLFLDQLVMEHITPNTGGRMDICCKDKGRCFQHCSALWGTFGLLLAKSSLLPCNVPIDWCSLGSGSCYLSILCMERVNWVLSRFCFISYNIVLPLCLFFYCFALFWFFFPLQPFRQNGWHFGVPAWLTGLGRGLWGTAYIHNFC